MTRIKDGTLNVISRVTIWWLIAFLCFSVLFAYSVYDREKPCWEYRKHHPFSTETNHTRTLPGGTVGFEIDPCRMGY